MGQIATSDGDGLLRIWDADTHCYIGTLNAAALMREGGSIVRDVVERVEKRRNAEGNH